MVIAKASYSIADQLPRHERFELAQQIRRSAVSVPSNIAEGSGRGTDGDFARFLRISYASACELETQILLAHELGCLEAAPWPACVSPVEELRKMLFTLIRRLGEQRPHTDR